MVFITLKIYLENCENREMIYRFFIIQNTQHLHIFVRGPKEQRINFLTPNVLPTFFCWN